MKTLNSINSNHWQPHLTQAGAVVENNDDIAQAIQIILTTQRGSDPHRPLFGSNLYHYLDWPLQRAIPYVVRETIEAISQWEPRITVVSVLIELIEHQLKLSVKWKTKQSISINQTQVIYERATTLS